MCMETLSLHIQQLVNEGIWKPIVVSRGGPAISHLLFTDDIFLFCKVQESQAHLITTTLDTFCSESGWKVNLHKSTMMSSKGIPNRMKNIFKDVCGIASVSNLGRYLGFSLVQGRQHHQSLDFILDKIHRRLASWKGKLLNRAGWLCLAKYVLSSLPMYIMQLFWLP